MTAAELSRCADCGKPAYACDCSTSCGDDDMTDNAHPDLHEIISRLTKSGDHEAARIINKLVDDLALSEDANAGLETKTALAEKAREDAESRNEFLIQEIEAAIVRSKTKEARP